MEKFKICPVCGMRNKPNMIECLGCETDLTSVKTTDEETEKAKNDTPKSAVSKSQEHAKWKYFTLDRVLALSFQERRLSKYCFL